MRYLPNQVELALRGREREECPQRIGSRRVLPPNAEELKRIEGHHRREMDGRVVSNKSASHDCSPLPR
jgi:hypothetical protein